MGILENHKLGEYVKILIASEPGSIYGGTVAQNAEGQKFLHINFGVDYIPTDQDVIVSLDELEVDNPAVVAHCRARIEDELAYLVSGEANTVPESLIENLDNMENYIWGLVNTFHLISGNTAEELTRLVQEVREKSNIEEDVEEDVQKQGNTR